MRNHRTGNRNEERILGNRLWQDCHYDCKSEGENIIVTAPAGWVATVSEADETTNVATLSITAPANAMSTRATADNGSDVTVQVNMVPVGRLPRFR